MIYMMDAYMLGSVTFDLFQIIYLGGQGHLHESISTEYGFTDDDLVKSASHRRFDEVWADYTTSIIIGVLFIRGNIAFLRVCRIVLVVYTRI